MKKIFLLTTAFALTLASFAQNTQTAQTTQPKAEDLIKVNAEKHDFGKIVQGTPVVYSFEIKNVSDKPIVIENTWASCGCTTPDKIVDPILPGKTAPLKVQYNAAAASAFIKDIYIKIAVIDQPKSIQITGEVLTADAYQAFKSGKTGTDTAPVKTTTAPVKNSTTPSSVPTKSSKD
jgi:hypothetical protein